ncbi:hypothetical protein [Neisseria sp.]
MKNIKFTLTIFFSGISTLWLFATPFPDKWGVFPIRNSSPAASAYWP